jgi:hypothetical protein
MRAPRLHRGETAGAALLGAGLLVWLCAAIFGAETGFWKSFTGGFKLAGWLLTLGGGSILALDAAARRTGFLDLDRPIRADVLALTCGGVLAAIIVATLIVVPQLPATPPKRLPPDPQAREKTLQTERHFRGYVVTAFVLTGVAVVSIPVTRFLRH